MGSKRRPSAVTRPRSQLSVVPRNLAIECEAPHIRLAQFRIALLKCTGSSLVCFAKLRSGLFIMGVIVLTVPEIIWTTQHIKVASHGGRPVHANDPLKA